MKIEMNIEKKYLYFFAAFLVLIGIGYVIASGTYNSDVYHASLLVDFLKSKTDASPVTVEDDLNISIGKNLILGGEICDGATSPLVCYPLSELVNNGGESESHTYSGTDLIHGGNKLFNDVPTAQEFCSEKGFTEYTDLVPSTSNCDPIYDLAKYSSSGWTNWDCGDTSTEKYISSLKCTGGTLKVYSFNNGEGDLRLSIQPRPVYDPISAMIAPMENNYKYVASISNSHYFIYGGYDLAQTNADEFCKAAGYSGSDGYTTVTGMIGCSYIDDGIIEKHVYVTPSSYNKYWDYVSSYPAKILISYEPNSNNDINWIQKWECGPATTTLILDTVSCV